MKLRLSALLAMCLIISGCVEGPTIQDKDAETLSTSVPGGIPDPYYAVADPWLDQSIFGVEALIGSGLLRSYSQDDFDCSEMAAYLEWMLQKHGFDAKVCLSNSFVETNMPHAWVAVDTACRRYYIEPTARNRGGFSFSVIKPQDGNYRDYDRYDGIYDDIYELSRAAPITEFDWWSDPGLRHNLEEAHSGNNS
ncbi:MAG: hypothetical protein HPY61_08695 [Methanotrichaceae archaeon]|nr:hypothetical protein [Methanotrichaceae archaeon]